MSLVPIAQGSCPSDCFLNGMGNHDAVHRTIKMVVSVVKVSTPTFERECPSMLLGVLSTQQLSGLIQNSLPPDAHKEQQLNCLCCFADG